MYFFTNIEIKLFEYSSTAPSIYLTTNWEKKIKIKILRIKVSKVLLRITGGNSLILCLSVWQNEASFCVSDNVCLSNPYEWTFHLLVTSIVQKIDQRQEKITNFINAFASVYKCCKLGVYKFCARNTTNWTKPKQTETFQTCTVQSYITFVI